MSICTTARNIGRTLSRRLREERGQSLVEFAVVLPVLIVIILGIVYFGKYEDYSNQATQLAETGVRYAAVDNCPTGCSSLASYIVSQASPELANGSGDVTKATAYIYLPTGVTYLVGNQIRVCIVSTVRYPTPAGTLSFQLTQAATMRVEAKDAAGMTAFSSSTPAASTNCPLS
jgi:Flp pilus assembly protein TadG